MNLAPIDIDQILDLKVQVSNPESASVLVDLFAAAIIDLGISELFEIGSFDGESARKILSLCPDVKIFSAEANPEIHKTFLSLNNDSRHKYVNICIGDSNGDATPRIPTKLSQICDGREVLKRNQEEPPTTGKSSLLYRNESASYKEIVVPQLTLDSFFNTYHSVSTSDPRNIALWIDVEGAQSIVLSESIRTLEKSLIVFIEIEGYPFWENGISHSKLLKMFAESGFIPVARDYEYGNYQFNVILLHKSMLLKELGKE